MKLRKEQVFSVSERCRGVKLSFSDTGNEWAGCGKRTHGNGRKIDLIGGNFNVAQGAAAPRISADLTPNGR